MISMRIRLATYDSTSIEVSLQAAGSPGTNGQFERILSRSRSTISGLGVLVAGGAGSSTVSTGGRAGDVVTQDLGTVLADKSTELIDLGALRNGDAVLVAELLELSLTPSIDELVGQGSVGSVGTGGRGGGGILRLEVGETRVAADGGNELVARAGLRGGETVGVKPLLEIRLGPRLVQPVTGVGGSLASLLGNGLVVGSDLLQERVAGAGLRDCNEGLVLQRNRPKQYSV